MTNALNIIRNGKKKKSPLGIFEIFFLFYTVEVVYDFQPLKPKNLFLLRVNNSSTCVTLIVAINIL